jgi:hypothetical protein
MIVSLRSASYNCYPLLIVVLGGSAYERLMALYFIPDGACFDS